MHVFFLILTISGSPERIAAVCETYKQCSDVGEVMQVMYLEEFHKRPEDYSYRVEPGIVIRGTGKTT